MTASVMTARPHNAAGRGGNARKRHHTRADRDGDLKMDTAAPRSKITKAARPTSQNRQADVVAAKIQKSGFQRQLLASLQRAAPAKKSKNHLAQVQINEWRNSKASTETDGGVDSLIQFVERRVNTFHKRLGARHNAANPPFKIDHHSIKGDSLLIFVDPKEVANILRLDGYGFAGVNIKVFEPDKNSMERETGAREASPGGSEMRQMFQEFLNRRYDPTAKLLNLSELGQDEGLNAVGMFATTSTQSKFFPALMKICDEFLKTPEEKMESIQSVTLARNNLDTVTPVTTLAQTFPDLKNLDLSNNHFKTLSALEPWRRKFRQLDHLVLNNNPLEQQEPEYYKQVINWYPRLRILNGAQVQSDEELAMKQLKESGKLALPVLGPNFQDESQIAENFLKSFFTAFDAGRAQLANQMYDLTSTFSIAVNTQAPRDPEHPSSTQPQEWEHYIKRSRNLKKLSHLPARMSREYRGPQAITECWQSLPSTRHPTLDAANLSKWLLECHALPGVPDPSVQAKDGVIGLIITTHGEYEETQGNKVRSFDRTFVLGPGGPSGIRVVSDMLTVRAYGGSTAFQPST